MNQSAFALIAFLTIIASVWSRSEARSAPGDYSELLSADLVIRGSVASIKSELVPASEYMREWTRGGLIRILFVRVSIDEVLLGYETGDSLTLTVNLNNSASASRWNVGDEIITPLRYKPDFRGGFYSVYSSYDRYVRDGSTWVSGGPAHSRSLDELRAGVSLGRPSEVSAAADRVVVGTLLRAEKFRIADSVDTRLTSSVWNLELRIDERLKGVGDDDTLVFKCFISGAYWPEWASPGPWKLEVGRRYCAFLASDGRDTYVVGGVNGLFEVDSDETLVRNSRRIPVTVGTVRNLVRKAED